MERRTCSGARPHWRNGGHTGRRGRSRGVSLDAGRLGSRNIRKVGDSLGVPVFQDLKILRLEICNVAAFGVGDDSIHLHQVDRDANHALLAGLVTQGKSRLGGAACCCLCSYPVEPTEEGSKKQCGKNDKADDPQVRESPYATQTAPSVF